MEQLYFYLDDSGVFHDNGDTYCTFGGYCFLSKKEKDGAMRKYKKVEKQIKSKYDDIELKSFTLQNKDAARLFRSMNQYRRFGTVIYVPHIHEGIKSSKYDRQRYLDYAVLRAIKKKIAKLISEGLISPYKDYQVIICMDEHTTSSNALYDFNESLRRELCEGKYNYRNNFKIKPIFKSNNSTVELKLCNSETNCLVRASDLVANKLYRLANAEDWVNIGNGICIQWLP